MSHFYGTIKGSRGMATRCGSKNSGMVTIAASWNGAIEVTLSHDETTGEDKFTINQRPWESRGIWKVIAEGIIGKDANEK